jgi:hypothetical protein
MTVACVWVRGHVPYSAEYVTRLAAMVRRWIDRPYRFVCLTDRPEALPGVETIRIPSPSPLRGWWAKVRLFDPVIGLAGRVLYLDLDTLIVGPLGPIIDYPATVALAPPGGAFVGRDGLSVVYRYNSSVMVWNAGALEVLHREWTPAVADRLWGDQDWIGERYPSAALLPSAWLPRLSTVTGPPFGDAKVILAKVPKNHVAAGRWPWVADIWRAA